MIRMMQNRWFSARQAMFGLIMVAGMTMFVAAGCGESPVENESKQQTSESAETADGSSTTTSGNGSDTK